MIEVESKDHVHPAVVSAKEGDDVEVNCYSAAPRILSSFYHTSEYAEIWEDYIWTFEQNTLHPNVEVYNGYTPILGSYLKINNIQLENAGVYQCSFVIKNGSKPQQIGSVTISVTSMPFHWFKSHT